MIERAASFDFAVIGGGPAGLAAAREVARSGRRVCVIDEQPSLGGQILRKPPPAFEARETLTGRPYDALNRLVSSAQGEPNIEWRLGETVVGAFHQTGDGYNLWTETKSEVTRISCKALLLAQGCYERAIAFPGWTLPGVMGAGALQTLLKSQKILPGQRILFSGSHPLQLLAAAQAARAGAEIVEVLFAQSFDRVWRALSAPWTMYRARHNLLQAGNALRYLVQSGVPVRFRRSAIRADGDGELESVTTAQLNASGAIVSEARQQSVDTLALCYGFQVSTEIGRSLGAQATWAPFDGGWGLDVNEDMETSVASVFAAGEMVGQFGAEAAIWSGTLAGYGVSKKFGTETPRRQVRSVARKFERVRNFSRMLNRLAAPPPRLAESLASDDVVICRCERINVQELDEAIATLGAGVDANALKLYSRVGMGLCQGRLCYANMAQRVGHQTPDEMDAFGPFTARFPAKPVAISSVLRLDA